MNEKSDEELIKGMQYTTDPSTVKVLYTIIVERNYKPLTTYVKGLVKGDTFDAHDIVHSAFIKALENYNSFDNKSSVNTWLCAIARNDYYSSIRTAKRRPPTHDVPIDEFILEDEPILDPEYLYIKGKLMEAFTDYDDPSNIYQSVQTLEEIEELIDDLPEHLQQLYTMRYVDQLEYNEIAEKLQVPVSTIKNRLFELNYIINRIVNVEGC